MENKGKVKFIRKGGRVIPIKDDGKGGNNSKKPNSKKWSAEKHMKKSKEHGKKARKADKKFKKEYSKMNKFKKQKSESVARAGVVGVATGMLFGKGNMKSRILGTAVGTALGMGIVNSVHKRRVKNQSDKSRSAHTERYEQNYLSGRHKSKAQKIKGSSV